MARRIYRQFVYGFKPDWEDAGFYFEWTGTWGPPLRLGSNPEIVMLQFEWVYELFPSLSARQD